MKIRTKVRAGSTFNRNAKKLVVKRPRGVIVKTGVKGGASIKW